VAIAMRIEEVRSGLVVRLRSRQREIEQAMLTRVRSVSEDTGRQDPEYAEGLRVTVAAALDYGIEAAGRGEDRAPPMPTTLLSQARLAARNGVSLDTVLRRYFAGYTVLGDFVIEESERGGYLKGASLKRLLRAQATLFDRLLASVTEEYGREAREPHSSERRRAELVEGLLAGELLSPSSLDYELEGFHLGLIAVGRGAGKRVRELAGTLQLRVLAVPQAGEVIWAWLGASHPVDPDRVLESIASIWPGEISLAVGEPAEGLNGWRLSHRQAQAALPIALRDPESVVRYADVAVLASMLQDELLTTSLLHLYLDPLEAERDCGELARETLRAYFAADRNISSAAAALGAARHTVRNRLRAVEKTLGRPLSAVGFELEAALRIEENAKVDNRYSTTDHTEPAGA
jgi:PucR C-terminal helix-turn-helix domain/GGDEF-like domain